MIKRNSFLIFFIFFIFNRTGKENEIDLSKSRNSLDSNTSLVQTSSFSNLSSLFIIPLPTYNSFPSLFQFGGYFVQSIDQKKLEKNECTYKLFHHHLRLEFHVLFRI
jgi:hypothetical protein